MFAAILVQPILVSTRDISQSNFLSLVTYYLIEVEVRSIVYVHCNSDTFYNSQYENFLLFNGNSCTLREENISVRAFFKNYLCALVDIVIH
jgi:hypothetical protein